MNSIKERDHDHLHCIYFYYWTMNGTDKDITAYYYMDEDTPIRDKQDLARLVRKLGQNARSEDYAPPSHGQGFSAVPSRRKSYFVVLLDDKVAKFRDKNDFDIVFEGSTADNHSFFNAGKLDIDMSDDYSGDMVTAVYCSNLMRHRSGRNLKGTETEKYKVKLNPGGVSVRQDRDDGGTNQGGPIPPPMIPI